MSEPQLPRSTIVIPLFLVVFFGGGLLSIAGGVYLYFSWEQHFPPIADLQEQVRAARAISEEDIAAEEEVERTGVIDWMDELSDQYSDRAEEAANRMEDDLARTQAVPPPKTPPAIPINSETLALETLTTEVEELRAPATPPTTPSTSSQPPSNATPLTNGGTIEKMDDDWLPPGVSRSE
ncbi:MAG: hypothetical protein O3A92_15435 [Verrucomicrobia bacterium]|nr:hypothetical protein [Verrucomicrobiota bacterium]